MWSAARRRSRSSILCDRHAVIGTRVQRRIRTCRSKKRWLPVSASKGIQPSAKGEARRTGQSDTVDKPVARLPGRLVRSDNIGISHDEGKVALERHAAVRSDDGNLWGRSHLCPTVSILGVMNLWFKRVRTVFCKILAWSDITDARKVDGHDGGGIERREKGRNDVSTGEVSLNGGNFESCVIGRLGLNEGAQEVKSEGG